MKDNGTLENHREVVAEAERLEIKTKATLVLAELLFDQNIHTQVNFLQKDVYLSCSCNSIYTECFFFVLRPRNIESCFFVSLMRTQKLRSVSLEA